MSKQKCSCSGCGKLFVQNESSQITYLANILGRDASEQLCYNCALQKVTGGSCPEEGDFNTAALISGEISDQEWKWMQEDFRAVESGCSSCGEPDYCQETEYEDDYDDSDLY